MKLNEILEKNMRKISSQEKEMTFIQKRLREAENLNMKMLNELSTKNQTIETLNNELRKKKEKKEEKVFQRKSKKDSVSVSGDSSEIFLKTVAEMFLKEINILKITPSVGNNLFEKYFEDIGMTFKLKAAENIDNYSNDIEIKISQNLYLKNLLKVFIINFDKSRKFNSSKIPYSKLLSSMSSKETNFSQDQRYTISSAKNNEKND